MRTCNSNVVPFYNHHEMDILPPSMLTQKSNFFSLLWLKKQLAYFRVKCLVSPPNKNYNLPFSYCCRKFDPFPFPFKIDVYPPMKYMSET